MKRNLSITSDRCQVKTNTLCSYGNTVRSVIYVVDSNILFNRIKHCHQEVQAVQGKKFNTCSNDFFLYQINNNEVKVNLTRIFCPVPKLSGGPFTSALSLFVVLSFIFSESVYIF